MGTGFRTPTLNELYRQFRVGSITTLANFDLAPERLKGVEGGLNHALNDKLFWRVTGFWSRLKDPVSNVTIASQHPAEAKIWAEPGPGDCRPSWSTVPVEGGDLRALTS